MKRIKRLWAWLTAKPEGVRYGVLLYNGMNYQLSGKVCRTRQEAQAFADYLKAETQSLTIVGVVEFKMPAA